MEPIVFVVQSEPVPQPRQRHKAIALPNGRIMVQNYVPKDHPVHEFKKAVVRAARSAYAGDPIRGPVALELELVFPRPRALVWKRRPMPRAWYEGAADADNVAKAVMDPLTDAQIWVDDRQVTRLTVEKWTAAGDEQPHVRVTITPLANPQR